MKLRHILLVKNKVFLAIRIYVDLNDINFALEKTGWYCQNNFISEIFCDEMVKKYFTSSRENIFVPAKIGKNIKKGNIAIRKSAVQWIENWQDCEYLAKLNFSFDEIMISTSRYFFLSLKRFESQFSLYNAGGFYKTHLDQLKATRHRQLTCCLYLNDCVEGGELVLFKKGSKTEIEVIHKPKKGTMVIFFSADIYHEVRLVYEPRYSITTWFRDDEIIPFV